MIRPLAYVPEREIARYARRAAFRSFPAPLCGSQPNLQRASIKQMLAEWERKFPGRIESIFSALRNVEPAHLADPRLFDFAGAARRGMKPPLSNTYWVEPGRLLAGEYPAGDTQGRTTKRLERLLAAGRHLFHRPDAARGTAGVRAVSA